MTSPCLTVDSHSTLATQYTTHSMSSEHDDASEPLLRASNAGGTSNAGASRTTAADTGKLCNDDTTHIERNALGIREAVHYAPSNSRQISDSPCLLCCDLLIVLVIGGLLGVAGLLLIEVADASGPPGEMAGSVLVCGLAVFGLAGAALMPRDVNIAKAKPLLSGSSREKTKRVEISASEGVPGRKDPCPHNPHSEQVKT